MATPWKPTLERNDNIMSFADYYDYYPFFSTGPTAAQCGRGLTSPELPDPLVAGLFTIFHPGITPQSIIFAEVATFAPDIFCYVTYYEGFALVKTVTELDIPVGSQTIRYCILHL